MTPVQVASFVRKARRGPEGQRRSHEEVRRQPDVRKAKATGRCFARCGACGGASVVHLASADAKLWQSWG